jgi:hypothetical protein
MVFVEIVISWMERSSLDNFVMIATLALLNKIGPCSTALEVRRLQTWHPNEV